MCTLLDYSLVKNKCSLVKKKKKNSYEHSMSAVDTRNSISHGTMTEFIGHSEKGGIVPVFVLCKMGAQVQMLQN